jgi:hypothetical protein
MRVRMRSVPTGLRGNIQNIDKKKDSPKAVLYNELVKSEIYLAITNCFTDVVVPKDNRTIYIPFVNPEMFKA